MAPPPAGAVTADLAEADGSLQAGLLQPCSPARSKFSHCCCAERAQRKRGGSVGPLLAHQRTELS